MQIPIFRAKDRDSEQMVEGFYVEYPVANVPNNGDIVTNTNIAHCIFTHKPGMMGIINEPYVCTIDLATLEFVKFIDIPCKTGQIVL